jgi:hypothetical protein
MTYTCDGLKVQLHPCPTVPDHFKVEIVTPDSRYEYGDYPASEAHDLARRLIEDRRAWRSREHGDCWRPTIWEVRELEWRRGREFWRRGPGGLELSVSQPHDDLWRMYWGISPVVRGHSDPGLFTSHWQAMRALDALAEGGMKDALID